MAADRIRLDALIARIDALEVPIDRAEVQDELDRMAEHLQAVTARVAKLEVAPDQQPDPPAPRPRGVIGALRAERPASDGGPAD
jgi:hypothetical protein